MKTPKNLVKDMIGHNLSLDDNHKAIEGKHCSSCGHDLPDTGYGAQWMKTNHRCPYCGYRFGTAQKTYDPNKGKWVE